MVAYFGQNLGPLHQAQKVRGPFWEHLRVALLISHDSKTNQTEHVTIGLAGSSSQKNAGGHCLWMGVHPKYPKV